MNPQSPDSMPAQQAQTQAGPPIIGFDAKRDISATDDSSADDYTKINNVLAPSSAPVTLAKVISQSVSTSPVSLFSVLTAGTSPQLYELTATIRNCSSKVTAGTISVTYTDETSILRTIYPETFSGNDLNGYKLSQGIYPAIPITLVAKQGTTISATAVAGISGNLYVSVALKRV